jgi:hypothetical protein
MVVLSFASHVSQVVVSYESRKRELKIRLMNEGRSEKRLKDNNNKKIELRNLRVSHTLGSRQNKLEIPRDKDEVNKREIHECDGRAHDPDTMVAPLTPKPTRKAEALARAQAPPFFFCEGDLTVSNGS